MQSVYGKLIQQAQNGAKYHIDLKNHNLKIGNKTYIEEGKNVSSLLIYSRKDLEQYGIDDFIESDLWNVVIPCIYYQFAHSCPPVRKDRHKYKFKCIPRDELSMKDLIFGSSRHEMKAVLEGCILCLSVGGILKWQNELHWFWQCEECKDLIVYKDWVVDPFKKKENKYGNKINIK